MRKESGESVTLLVASLLDSITGLGQGWYEDGQRAGEFMDRLVDLGLLLRREPGLRQSDEMRTFLEGSGRTLESHLGALDKWLLDFSAAAAESFLVGDEWVSLARNRSALAFLRDLYSDTDWIERFDVHDLDETLRVRCERDALLDPSMIPADMPPEHWWWWCASAPLTLSVNPLAPRTSASPWNTAACRAFQSEASWTSRIRVSSVRDRTPSLR
jgi:hypothetical protein